MDLKKKKKRTLDLCIINSKFIDVPNKVIHILISLRLGLIVQLVETGVLTDDDDRKTRFNAFIFTNAYCTVHNFEYMIKENHQPMAMCFFQLYH